MDSTAAFAPDSAFHPEDALPLSATPLPCHGDDTAHTASDWLSQAMALWLQDPDAQPEGAPALTASRAAH